MAQSKVKGALFCHRCLFEFTVTAKVGADLFNFGLTVYSTNAKAGLAPWAL